QLRFLEQQAQMVKVAVEATNKPVGIGIDASCRLCLPLALTLRCRPLFTAQFDFVTFYSDVQQDLLEAYSYRHFSDQPRFEDVAIFYVLKAGNKQSVELNNAIHG